MKFILSKSNDPYFNLALEEYIVKNLNEDLFYLYINGPSVIIGKHQNPFIEVNLDYLNQNNILLVRRMSGGGAVYHDLGNINYSFILKDKKDDLYNFEKYSNPIVDFLNEKFDLNAKFGGRNDIQIENKKISGAAQFVMNDNLIHHGTLLLDVEFKNLDKILTPNYKKLDSKGVKSTKARVANIVDFLTEKDKFDKTEFTFMLLKYLSDEEEYIFNETERIEIEKIAKQKRESISFLLKNKKQYEYQISEYIPKFGTIQIYFNLEKDHISEFEIFGEYFSKISFEKLKDRFLGIKYNKEEIEKIVFSIKDFRDYFYNLEKEELISLIMMN